MVRLGRVRVSAPWLGLREAADAAARAPDLVESIRKRVAGGEVAVVHDLACGTGSMARWLAPRLSGPQHWVLHDWDADLLSEAVTKAPIVDAGGSAVTVEARRGDVTRLPAGELADASLVTTSALLDLLTQKELDRLVASCVLAGCAILLTLSVIGRVDVVPAHPLDRQFAEAFNAHQRRGRGGRRLLGPDAASAAVAALTRMGHHVEVRASPWRLGAGESSLAQEWVTGWVGAACEQEPALARVAPAYLRSRLAEAASGRLSVTVHHQDLLAWPSGSPVRR